MTLEPTATSAALCLGIPILLLFAFLVYVALAFMKDQADARRQRAELDQVMTDLRVDQMSQTAFRWLVARLMEQQGYVVSWPEFDPDGPNQDLGTDFIATKDGKRYAVFAIRYAQKPISPGAIRWAMANRARYGCDAAMIVTNGVLGDAARRLAQSSGCAWIDRAGLGGWIMAGQRLE
jgi:HJR/Mrr/RecB family endonuclease